MPEFEPALEERKVWVVWIATDDSDNPVALFTTEELAQTFVTRSYAERYADEYSLLNEDDRKELAHPNDMTNEGIDLYFRQFDSNYWVTEETLKGPL